MNVSLTPELYEFVKKLVESGCRGGAPFYMAEEECIDMSDAFARTCCWITGALFLGACGEVDADPTHFQVSDSSGVRIVESGEPSGDRTWRIGDAPEVRIGSVDGASEEQFTFIVGAWRQRDGEIVAADGMANEIRVFGQEGAFRHSFGGAGDGPGEFRMLGAVAPYRGDSIIAWDLILKRLSVFDAGGALGRVESVVGEAIEIGEGDRNFGVPETLWGSFADGSLVMSPMAFVYFTSGGTRAFERPLLHVSPEGEVRATLDIEVLEEPPGQASPFPRVATVGVAGEQLYVGSDERHEVFVRDALGLRAVVRIPDRVLVLGADDRAEFTARYEEEQRELGRSDQEIAQGLRNTSFPTVLPPFSSLIIDDEDYLWLQEYRLRSDTRPAKWNVFDPEGRWVATMEIPAGFRVHQIEQDAVVGVRTDDLGVPFLEVYSLSRD